MVELTELLQPIPEETEARQAAVNEVADVVKSLFPTAQVTVFGSFATGEEADVPCV
jgi:DNA polymerase sigma